MIGAMKICRIVIRQIAVLFRRISAFTKNSFCGMSIFTEFPVHCISIFTKFFRLGFYKMILRNKFLLKTEIRRTRNLVKKEIRQTGNLMNWIFDES